MTNVQPPISPVPIPVSSPPPSILVFGGTFDPPHRGHIELPVRIREALERSGTPGIWLLYVPAARSPFKPDGPIASDADRLAMLKLALDDARVERAAVWTDEIDRAAAAHAGEPSYTVDTLGRLRAWLDDHGTGGTRLFLLIGADQALSFHKWRQPRDLLKLARPVVMIRGEVRDAAALNQALETINFWGPVELRMWSDAILPVGRVDVSATDLRRALARDFAGELGTWLSHRVGAYIREHGLYRS